MKAKEVYYERTFPLGNFQSEKIGTLIQLDDGDKADMALSLAKKWVNKHHAEGKPVPTGVDGLNKSLGVTK